jgi:hypothetical protein
VGQVRRGAGCPPCLLHRLCVCRAPVIDACQSCRSYHLVEQSTESRFRGRMDMIHVDKVECDKAGKKWPKSRVSRPGLYTRVQVHSRLKMTHK